MHLIGRTCAFLWCLLLPTLAFAEVPSCEGTRDAEAIEREARLGRDSYLRALRSRSGVDQAVMREALQHFDAWCAAGDDAALEFRAYALRALGRSVDAAESLDAFVRRHPPATLSEAVRTRLEANWSIVESAVATLALTCTTEGARVRINGRDYGTTPLRPIRHEAGMVLVELSAEGFLTQSRYLELTRGNTQFASFSLVPISVVQTPTPAPAITPPTPTPVTPPPDPPPPEPTPPEPPTNATMMPVLDVPLRNPQVDPRVLQLPPQETTPSVPPTPTPTRTSLLPWIIGTASASLVLAGVGIVPSVLVEDCRQTASCGDRKGMLEGLQVGFFVSAGLSLGASGILLLLDRAPR